MTRETIKEYILQVKSQDGTEALYNRWEPDILVEVINEIFNDHEAQLKLASDVYLTDKMHMYQELKAKDKITQDIKEAYELKSIAYDLLLEAIQLKDEEIERLKSYIEKLWQIVDDIDTYGDMAKSNDAMFRSLVENKQKKRWELPITTDGYKLIYKDTK